MNSIANSKPKIAAIITEYRYNSHAEVIVGRLLGRMGYEPQIEVATLYMDQFPDNDMSREEAAYAGIPICPTIKETIITAHRDRLDGVLIIGEHGVYPVHSNGQKKYPRRRFLEETLNVLDEINVRVPIFSDKHLSWNIDDALWMYNALNDRSIPFMGGSSIPHVPLVPELDRSSLQNPQQILAVSFGGTEDYGFHAWETVQYLAEKRIGGESGVKSVRAIQGEQVWDEMDQGLWPEPLMHLALATYSNPKEGHPRTRINNPVLMTVEYLDGLTGYVLQLPNEIEQWAVAWTNFENKDYAVRFDSGLGRPFRHFGILTETIESMIITGQSSVPIERTLLTTGMIHYAMESLISNSIIDTPLLRIEYSPY